MPLVLDVHEEDTAGIGDVVAYLQDERIDTTDPQSLVQAAPMLKRLANNRSFLAELAIEELKDLCVQQDEGNNYTAQVMMLAAPRGYDQNFFLRANFWPSPKDAIFRTTGADPFSYGKPHDHNFNFLTVGYLGPGYWSNYYEYDYDAVAGYAGEPVGLRFVERERLHEGKVMLYRAFLDIHEQLPADAMSISLNIGENSLRSAVLDQYAFDLETSQVTEIINRHSAVGLMPVAAVLGAEATQEVILNIFRRHPSDRVRFLALRAVAGAQASVEGSLAVLERGLDDRSPMVAGLSRSHLERLRGVAG